MEKLSESMKKIVLAGIGAVATTAEKSKEVLDDLVKKGELTVEQGKVLNEELKHNVITQMIIMMHLIIFVRIRINFFISLSPETYSRTNPNAKR